MFPFNKTAIFTVLLPKCIPGKSHSHPEFPSKTLKKFIMHPTVNTVTTI